MQKSFFFADLGEFFGPKPLRNKEISIIKSAGKADKRYNVIIDNNLGATYNQRCHKNIIKYYSN
jgi:hypothetical protein